MEQLLEHTYLWAETGGDVNVAALQSMFVFVLAVSAVFFLVLYLAVPHTPLERRMDPRVDATPKVFLIFTKGQMVSYPLNVIGIPVMATSVYPYPPGWPVGELPWAACISACVLAFYILPAIAQKAIDGSTSR